MKTLLEAPLGTRLLPLLLGLLAPLHFILGQAPTTVTVSPLSLTVSLGATARFQANSDGEFPKTYQWLYLGAVLDGATNNPLVLSNATPALDGDYRVVAANGLGAVTSGVVVLRVDPTFTKITQGPVVEDREPSTSGAWGDFDNDGRLDLFVANSGWNAGGHHNSLYRNLGGDEFVRVTNALTATVAVSWNGQWADFDNDGDLDLFVVHPRVGRNELFVNGGGGVFTALRNAATLTSSGHTDASWVDHDGDGWLDLFVPVQGGIDGDTRSEDYFFGNLRDGTFRQWWTNDLGEVVGRKRNTYGASWADVDGDGDLDLFVPGEGGSALYRNDRGFLQFVQAGSLPGLGAYGSAWADFNNDGWMDLVTCGQSIRGRLHLNRGNWVFEEVGATSGFDFLGNAFNLAVGDYDNDGDLDIYVPGYGMADACYRNRGDATFERVDVGSPLLEGTADSATWVDYNDDGFLDLFKACGDLSAAPNLLYRNSLPQTGNTNHWLKLRLKGTASNASAIGAQVRVRATVGGHTTWQTRNVVSSFNGSGSMDGLILHFGLGDATNVDVVRIEWPSGNVQVLTNVVSDQALPVTEPLWITPARPTASVGGAVQLRSSVGGAASWQWYRGGVELVGATDGALSLSNLVVADGGRYTLVTTLVDGTRQTNHSYLVMDGQFRKVTDDPSVTELGTTWAAVWGDTDEDGDMDLVAPRYSAGVSSVYENRGDGSFTSSAGFLSASVGLWFSPVLADFDQDGLGDCFVTRYGGPSVFQYQEPGGVFTTVNSLSLSAWSVCAFDYDRDGRLDLYFPSSVSGSNNRLLQNLGSRSFAERFGRDAGSIVAVQTFGGACAADYDDDGWVDLYAPDYRGVAGAQNRLFRNLGGRFVSANNAITRSATSAIAGAWGDYDNDGLVDLAVASFGGVSKVFRNLGQGEFEAATIGIAITGSYNGASWGDYDNDGFLDLFMTYGNRGGNSLFRNNGNGTFTRIETGSLVTDRAIAGAAAYGGLWFDANGDGFLDLYVVNGNDGGTARTANFLYLNQTNGNHWLEVRLRGTTSNPQGIGAKVRARAAVGGQTRWQRREITAGDMFNGNNLIAHFGLGSSRTVQTLRIEWPSGTVQEFSNVSADQVLTIVEPRRPEMTSRLLGDGSYQIEFTTEAGRSYEVQASDDLAEGEWIPVVTVTGTGNPIALRELVPLAPQRYYRVVSP